MVLTSVSAGFPVKFVPTGLLVAVRVISTDCEPAEMYFGFRVFDFAHFAFDPRAGILMVNVGVTRLLLVVFPPPEPDGVVGVVAEPPPPPPHPARASTAARARYLRIRTSLLARTASVRIPRRPWCGGPVTRRALRN